MAGYRMPRQGGPKIAPEVGILKTVTPYAKKAKRGGQPDPFSTNAEASAVSISWQDNCRLGLHLPVVDLARKMPLKMQIAASAVAKIAVARSPFAPQLSY